MRWLPLSPHESIDGRACCCPTQARAAARAALQSAAKLRAGAEQSTVLPALAAGATVAAATFGAVLADDSVIHHPAQPWSHNGMMDSFDAARFASLSALSFFCCTLHVFTLPCWFRVRSVRRGHQVYTQVCASCHGLARIAYRNLVGVCYSEAEAKAMAEDTDVMDGPNDEGEMFERPGKLSDYLPSPYPNEEAGCK